MKDGKGEGVKSKQLTLAIAPAGGMPPPPRVASHSRAFCRNLAALCGANFSFIRIWCVLIVLTFKAIRSLIPKSNR
jgi:hypothetical protein